MVIKKIKIKSTKKSKTKSTEKNKNMASNKKNKTNKNMDDNEFMYYPEISDKNFFKKIYLKK